MRIREDRCGRGRLDLRAHQHHRAARAARPAAERDPRQVEGWAAVGDAELGKARQVVEDGREIVGPADREEPVFTCPATATVVTEPGTCGASVTLTPSADDTCSGAAVALLGVPTGEIYGPGVYPIVQTAVDPSGNLATCETTVTVLDGNALTVACEAAMTVDAPSNLCGYPGALSAEVVDVCAPDVTVSSSADRFPVGITDVTFQAENTRGQTATCVTRLTVRDVTAPTVGCGVAAGAAFTVPAVFSAEVADACTATVAAHDARCVVRGADGAFTRVLGGCALSVRDGVVSVTAVPVRDDAGVVIAVDALAITWSVDAVDPSGNLATADCLAPLDASARDRDRDTVPDVVDNCPDVPNVDQRDLDLDGLGDRCDDAPYEMLQALGGSGCAADGTLGGWGLALLAVVMWAGRARRKAARR